MNIGTGW